MRRRIIDELEIVNRSRAQLEEQTLDLQRSNAELEQFAYVASHDLQEPLRKVASFTGMLQHRYQGQLDERADQYIDFAVDGAKRMQVLINDLLAFSRVGRVGAEEQVVAMDEVAADAVADLGVAIEESGAQLTIDGPLPQVRGDRSLLTALLQNLFANAIKFRGDAPPRVRLSWERTRDAEGGSDTYTFTVSDNGIGIAPRYADRIFVIFQRLHPRRSSPARASAWRCAADRRVPRRPHRARPRPTTPATAPPSVSPSRSRRGDHPMIPSPPATPSRSCSSRTTRATCSCPRGVRRQQDPQHPPRGRRRREALDYLRGTGAHADGPPDLSCSTSTCRAWTAVRCCRVKSDPDLRMIPWSS